MISILARLLIKDYKNTSDGRVRRAYGMLCSIVGISLNIILFTIKYFAGTISGSIAITADAFNNLSDAGSSIITLIGFKAAGSLPDADHPFGHGRYEYISGFIVSVIVILMAFELGKSSIAKILHPSAVEFGVLPIVVLIISICIKLYMFLYNTRTGKKLNAPAMKTTALDSMSDCVSTSVVLISTIICRFTSYNIDGWGGIVVACFILYTGYGAARDTLSPLLGKAPSAELVTQIQGIIMAHSEIIGIHDLMVHDYGPGHMIISVHGEVCGDGNIYVLHDVIDRIENELDDKLGCEAVIHMDPVDTSDGRIPEMKNAILGFAHTINSNISIHDFRIVPGPTHNNLIFDLVLPPELEDKAQEIKTQICSEFSKRWPDCVCVIKAEQSYV